MRRAEVYLPPVRMLSSMNSPMRQSMPVEEPTFYQETFEQIDKAIFVRSKSS